MKWNECAHFNEHLYWLNWLDWACSEIGCKKKQQQNQFEYCGCIQKSTTRQKSDVWLNKRLKFEKNFCNILRLVRSTFWKVVFFPSFYLTLNLCDFYFVISGWKKKWKKKLSSTDIEMFLWKFRISWWHEEGEGEADICLGLPQIERERFYCCINQNVCIW